MEQRKVWEMNETQKAFVNELSKHADGITLLELKLEGKEFKSGSVNTLVSKGIVENAGEKEFACKVVYDGQIVGKQTLKRAVYRLVRKD